MSDGRWRTLEQISSACRGAEASVSARLRDLRKKKFGGHTVHRMRSEGGLFVYRLIIVKPTSGPQLTLIGHN